MTLKQAFSFREEWSSCISSIYADILFYVLALNHLSCQDGSLKNDFHCRGKNHNRLFSCIWNCQKIIAFLWQNFLMICRPLVIVPHWVFCFPHFWWQLTLNFVLVFENNNQSLHSIYQIHSNIMRWLRPKTCSWFTGRRHNHGLSNCMSPCLSVCPLDGVNFWPESFPNWNKTLLLFLEKIQSIVFPFSLDSYWQVFSPCFFV